MPCNDTRSPELRDLTSAAEHLPDQVLRDLLSLANNPEELQDLSEIASHLSRDELHDLRTWVDTNTRTGRAITMY